MHAVLLSLVFGLAWPSAEATRAAAERVLAKPDYQTTLPSRPTSTATPASRPAAERGAPSRPMRGAARTAREGIGTIVMLVIGGVLLGGVVIVATREARARPPRARDASGAAAPPRPLNVASSLLRDADALAGEGHFTDAVHALLLRTFEALARQAALPPALTSREILARVPMQPTAHAALAELVSAVELTLFGGAEAAASDYQRCADAFRRVLSAEGIRAR